MILYKPCSCITQRYMLAEKKRKKIADNLTFFLCLTNGHKKRYNLARLNSSLSQQMITHDNYV